MNDKEKSSTLITNELKDLYNSVQAGNYNFVRGGGIECNTNFPESDICSLVHAKIQNLLAFLITREKNPFQDTIPLNTKVPPKTMAHIAGSFHRVQSFMESSRGHIITKSAIAHEFGDFYHLLEPSTDASLYLRSIIERVFEVLELGPIPPSCFPDVSGIHTAISAEALKAYKTDSWSYSDIQLDGKLQPMPEKWVPSLIVDLNFQPIQLSLITGFYERANYQKIFPLAPDISLDEAVLAARAFSRVNVLLLDNKFGPPTREEVINAYGTFYHMLSEGTEANRYLRSLIERSFKILELGPIPPQFEHIETKRRQRKTCEEGGMPLP